MGQDLQRKGLRPAATALKLKLEEIETQADPKGLESAFQSVRQKQVNAIMTTTNRPFFRRKKADRRTCRQTRAASYLHAEGFVVEGGLMSYGVDSLVLHRRAAVYVDKILKGANRLICRYSKQRSLNLSST